MSLLDTVRGELAPAEGANRLVPLVAEGRLPLERLAALAGEEYRIIRSDRRSFLVLAARFPDPPAVDFFIGLAQGETLALSKLLAFAAALGMDEAALEAYEPRPGCQAYPAYVAWLALNGSEADVALALVANFAAWRRCRRSRSRPPPWRRRACREASRPRRRAGTRGWCKRTSCCSGTPSQKGSRSWRF